MRAESECAGMREALSARVDGADPGADDAAIDAHLASCAGCRAFVADVHALTRRSRLVAAVPAPDLAPMVVAARSPRTRHDGWVFQVGLVAAALVQITLAAGGYLGAAAGHATRDLAGFELAIAIGLLVAATRPAKAGPLVPVLGTLVVAAVFAVSRDIAAGVTTATAEAGHLLPLAGLVLLLVASRRAVA